MSITITLSHEKETLETLRDDWIDLQTKSSATGMALTWQWISIWYKHFNHLVDELWIMTARDDNRLVGIAPLMKVEEQYSRGFAWQQLEFIGEANEFEHLDFIIEAGYEEHVIPLFMKKLLEHNSRWDVMLLAGMSDTKTPEILQKLDNRWTEHIERKMVAVYATLPDTMDEWMSSVSHRRRKKLRRYPRKLDKEFPDRWTIKQVNQPDELDSILDHLVRLHQAWMDTMGEPGAFRHGNRTEYYRELMHCMLENGWLRLRHLAIDDEPCAIDYCYHYRGRAYAQIGAVDRDVDTNITVGDVLMHHNIDQAINEGLSEFSYMLGELSWKYSFGGVNREYQALRLINNPRVRLQIKMVDGLRTVKHQLLGNQPQMLETASNGPNDEEEDED